MKYTRNNTKELCMIGLTTSLICVIAPIPILLPTGVPTTLQTFIITLTAIILGAKPAFTATLIYVLLGAFGLPVFSNFTGGWQSITGPTGGFILSFPIMAYIIGRASDLCVKRKRTMVIGITIGTLLNFVCGIIQFCVVTKSSLTVGFATCVLPFIPLAILKAFLAYLIGRKIKQRIRNLEL